LASCIIIVVQAEEVPMPERIIEAERSEVAMIFMGICSGMKWREFERKDPDGFFEVVSSSPK